MCGLTGFWDIRRQTDDQLLEAIAREMSDTLVHRGPDDGGVWVDEEVGIALAHRRLAIVDLSPQGHQPMVSGDGRYVIVFNGEIYNFPELRQQLQTLGHKFRGGSDTEVLLASFTEWGVVEATKRCNGMFAFAVWDRQERILHLGRDRMGEKPLYYGLVNGVFLFSSELKAFKVHPQFQTEVNRDAIASLLRHSYIPQPHSIYKGIYKLPPAHILSWNGIDFPGAPQEYWSLRQATEQGISQPFTGSDTEAVSELENLLKDAVNMRMLADVPLGAFLSGGIDSSTIVALMQSQSAKAVKTFSIGFYEDEYNEASYAKAVAEHLGTEHTELYVTPQEALEVIPQIPTLFDEPFSDPSQVPTFLVSKLARKDVTVSLSGDAGDELFAGYNRYFWGRNIWQTIGWIPKSLRSTGARAITSLSPKVWDRIFESGSFMLPQKAKVAVPGERMHKIAQMLGVANSEAIYTSLVSHWKQPDRVVLNAAEPATALNDSRYWARISDFTEKMMYLDMMTYLPDDILVKVDRASMGVSLESRVPFLDHRIVEFAWKIPLSMKIREGQGKWLLRQVLYKYVPKHLIERPKMGFGLPIDRWLRSSLRDWGEELLNEKRMLEQGFFNPQPIRQRWEEHLKGDRNWQYYLWDVLMFQAWLKENC